MLLHCVCFLGLPLSQWSAFISEFGAEAVPLRLQIRLVVQRAEAHRSASDGGKLSETVSRAETLAPCLVNSVWRSMYLVCLL